MAADDSKIVEQIADDDDNFPADDDSNFPSDEENDKNIPWRNVVQNTWLMITRMNIIDTSSEQRMIVYLKNRNGALVMAWTTKIIEKNITLKNASKDEKKKVFIMSLGEKPAEKTKHVYYNLKISAQYEL